MLNANFFRSIEHINDLSLRLIPSTSVTNIAILYRKGLMGSFGCFDPVLSFNRTTVFEIEIARFRTRCFGSMGQNMGSNFSVLGLGISESIY